MDEEKRQLGTFLWLSKDQLVAIDPTLFIHLSAEVIEKIITINARATVLDPSFAINRQIMVEMNALIQYLFQQFFSSVEEQLQKAEEEKRRKEQKN